MIGRSASTLLVVMAYGVVSMSAATPNKRAFKVYHGDRVSDWATNPFKFMAAVSGGGLCSAFIHDSKSLVSAGHCFMHDSKPQYAAFEYTSLQSGVSRTIPIEKYFVPEYFQRNFKTDAVNGKDISVVRLKEAIDYSMYDVTNLPCLMDKRPEIGATITVIGYGFDSYAGDQPGLLKSGKMRLINCGRTRSTGEPLCLVPEEQFAMQRNERGDSGGPAVMQIQDAYVGVGVSSGILTYRSGSKVAIYSSLFYNKDHIANYTTASV